MYTKGLLRVVTPPCERVNKFGYCPDEHHEHRVTDYCNDYLITEGEFCVFLPHSCDSWVIGGVDEVCALINDLIEVVVSRLPLGEETWRSNQ
jgi:hypothetical protein